MLDITVKRLFAAQQQEAMFFESDDAYQKWKTENGWEIGGPHTLVRMWHKSVEGYDFSLFEDSSYGNRDYLVYKGPKDAESKVRSVDRDGFFGERIHAFYVEGDDDIKNRHDVINKSFVVNIYKLTKVRV